MSQRVTGQKGLCREGDQYMPCSRHLTPTGSTVALIFNKNMLHVVCCLHVTVARRCLGPIQTWFKRVFPGIGAGSIETVRVRDYGCGWQSQASTHTPELLTSQQPKSCAYFQLFMPRMQLRSCKPFSSRLPSLQLGHGIARFGFRPASNSLRMYVCTYVCMYVCIYIYTCAYYSGLSYKAHRGVTSLFSVTQEALLETPAKESTARGFVVILINLACNGSKSELCHAHSPSEAIRASL